MPDLKKSSPLQVLLGCLMVAVKLAPEYRLLDTGVSYSNRYFDVQAGYAKQSPMTFSVA